MTTWNDYKDHIRRNNPEIGKDIDDAEKNSRIVDSHGDDESGWLEQAMETFQHFMVGEAEKAGFRSEGEIASHRYCRKLVPNQDADAVRLIYTMYLEGKNIEAIRRLLADYGVRTRKGTLISHNDILYILKNETYRGDKLLQKQPPKDFLTKKPDKRAHYESHYLEGDHEAIVEPVMWNAVQEKLKQKKEIENAVGHRGGQPHFLYGLIFCDECGAPMTRRTLRAYDGSSYKAWTCRERHKGRKGNGCTCRTIRETDLLASICVQMGWEKVTEEKMGEIERVMVSDDSVEIVKKAERITA